MTAMKNPTDLLKGYYYKSLLIQLSTKTIDDNWGEELSISITNHVFTDPFQIAEQTDEIQVKHFNQLMNTDLPTIKWRMVKSPQSQLYLDKENKDEFISSALSQLYLQLSIPLFENLIVLIKSFLDSCTSWKSFNIINNLYTEFDSELKDLDEKNVSYQYPTVLLLHSLRLFRNCITHSDGEVSDLEKAFDGYNKNMDENKNGYKILKDLGHLSKTKFCYRFSKEGTKIFLDKKAFKDLTDLYSQIAYVVYRCFCKKHRLAAEI